MWKLLLRCKNLIVEEDGKLQRMCSIKKWWGSLQSWKSQKENQMKIKKKRIRRRNMNCFARNATSITVKQTSMNMWVVAKKKIVRKRHSLSSLTHLHLSSQVIVSKTQIITMDFSSSLIQSKRNIHHSRSLTSENYPRLSKTQRWRLNLRASGRLRV